MATFVRKIVTENFQKSPNLVTLPSVLTFSKGRKDHCTLVTCAKAGGITTIKNAVSYLGIT